MRVGVHINRFDHSGEGPRSAPNSPPRATPPRPRA